MPTAHARAELLLRVVTLVTGGAKLDPAQLDDWTVQHCKRWLLENGLAERCAVFQRAAIDGPALRMLTKRDLADMNIVLPAEVRKILTLAASTAGQSRPVSALNLSAHATPTPSDGGSSRARTPSYRRGAQPEAAHAAVFGWDKTRVWEVGCTRRLRRNGPPAAHTWCAVAAQHRPQELCERHAAGRSRRRRPHGAAAPRPVRHPAACLPAPPSLTLWHIRLEYGCRQPRTIEKFLLDVTELVTTDPATTAPRDWTVWQVRHWLLSSGMFKLLPMFQRGGIDGRKLLVLTRQDLYDMGIEGEAEVRQVEGSVSLLLGEGEPATLQRSSRQRSRRQLRQRRDLAPEG